jgi:hypothetical protein
VRLDQYANEEWLFHGSPHRCLRLEPHQAYDWSDGTPVVDGEPAVFATHALAVAVFMAIMPSAIGANGSFAYELGPRGDIELTATSLASRTTARGFVHVVTREGFSGPRGLDWWCTDVVTPVAIFEVSGDDLPPVRISRST